MCSSTGTTLSTFYAIAILSKYSSFHVDPDKEPYLHERMQGSLLARHGEDLRRLRALVAIAFRHRVVESLNDVIRQIANDLIDRMPDEGEVDLVEMYSKPFPAKVLGPMLGIGYEEVDGLDEWVTASSRWIDPLEAKNRFAHIVKAWKKLEHFLVNLLEERRSNLGEDIFSELIAAEIEGDKLSRTELVGIAGQLARAGVETTRYQLALIIHQLLLHPDEIMKLRRDLTLSPHAVEEGMRFAPLGIIIPQEAVTEHVYRDLCFTPGQVAMVLLPATNRDPSLFEHPHKFDITREPRRNLTLGFGAHYCSGAQLARMEMSIALECLMRRTESIELTEKPELGLLSEGCFPLSLKIAITKSDGRTTSKNLTTTLS